MSNSRGFGVHSPFAYRFIRYVINEHYPYYIYQDLADLEKKYSSDAVKFAKLLFRIANYSQARIWLHMGQLTELEENYIKGGCRRVSISEISSVDDFRCSSDYDVACVENSHDSLSFAEQLVQHASPRSILIIKDIYANKSVKAYWEQLCIRKDVGVCFDLYYCGIAFFDLTMNKQSYKANF